jgi:hypothetical protein
MRKSDAWQKAANFQSALGGKAASFNSASWRFAPEGMIRNSVICMKQA